MLIRERYVGCGTTILALALICHVFMFYQLPQVFFYKRYTETGDGKQMVSFHGLFYGIAKGFGRGVVMITTLLVGELLKYAQKTRHIMSCTDSSLFELVILALPRRSQKPYSP